jgi:hypothetical protein
MQTLTMLSEGFPRIRCFRLSGVSTQKCQHRKVVTPEADKLRRKVPQRFPASAFVGIQLEREKSVFPAALSDSARFPLAVHTNQGQRTED